VWLGILNCHSFVLYAEKVQKLGFLVVWIIVVVSFVSQLVTALAKVFLVILAVPLGFIGTQLAGWHVEGRMKRLNIDPALDDMRQEHILG
jgi:hypothetical protein